MLPLISIIVPIYNVEEYLPRCIDSILVQSYDNIEIILVEDGSTDHCGSICDRYAANNDKITVIYQSNAGLSSARNAGIDVAKGEYLAFVDSDDWILPTHIEQLYETLRQADVLLSICQSKRVKSAADAAAIEEQWGYYLLDKISLMHEALTKYKWWAAWDKLFHRSLFESVRFPVGRINEDYAIIFYIFDKCDQIAVGNQTTYCYFEREGSITKTRFNKSKLSEYVNAVEVLDFMNSHYLKLVAPAENILAEICLKLLSEIAMDKSNQYDEWRVRICATMRSTVATWIRNPYLTWKNKTLLLPCYIGWRSFVAVQKVYHKLWK